MRERKAWGKLRGRVGPPKIAEAVQAGLAKRETNV